MSTTTRLRTVSSIDDIRAVLSGSNPARLFSIGTAWNKIRVGIRAITTATAAMSDTPRFAVGVCSGTTNRWNIGSALTTHFVGEVTNSSLWGYSSNAIFGNDFCPCKRVGTTLTVGTSTGAIGFGNITNNKRQMLFVDITKGSPNFTFNHFSVNPFFGADVSKETFLANMVIEVAAATDYQWGTARTLAVDEADGELNAVNLSWDRTTPEIEICDVAVARLG